MHHLSIAYGSLGEVETQVAIAQRLGYLDQLQAETVTALIAEIGRLINGLSNKLPR